jgi:hypothetical protein
MFLACRPVAAGRPQILEREIVEHPVPVIIQNPQIVGLMQILHNEVAVFAILLTDVIHGDFVGHEFLEAFGFEFLDKIAIFKRLMGCYDTIGPDPVRKMPAFMMPALSVICCYD